MSTDEMLKDVTTKSVFVDDVSYAGSAFAATTEGEGVFINARIVEAMKVKGGDYLKAWVLPNYEDKREHIPWRAMRVEVLGSAFDDISDQPQDETPLEPEVSKDELIVQKLEDYGPMRTSVIARLLGVSTGEAGTLCHGLFAQGKIAMADIYSDPSNKRSSHRVWALDINEYDVDPFDETDQE